MRVQDLKEGDVITAELLVKLRQMENSRQEVKVFYPDDIGTLFEPVLTEPRDLHGNKFLIVGTLTYRAFEEIIDGDTQIKQPKKTGSPFLFDFMRMENFGLMEPVCEHVSYLKEQLDPWNKNKPWLAQRGEPGDTGRPKRNKNKERQRKICRKKNRK